MSANLEFFDLQVNGYGGVDFNADDVTVEQIAQACSQLQQGGVVGFLATIITDDVDHMCARIRRIVEARDADENVRRAICGIHVEGPFLNECDGFVGTHPKHAVQPATVEAVEEILDAGAGTVKLVTLAPERDEGFAVARWLTDRGVRVAAGHCDPSLDELKAAIDNGLCMFTHLGNGCPLLLHRHDNVIQRVLSLSDQLWISFIADGVHVPFPALKNYIKAAGVDRAVVVSDAISAAGLGPGAFTLGSQEVVVDERLATWSPDRSHLMGSAVSMRRAHENLISQLQLTPDDVRQLTSVNPRQVLGLGTDDNSKAPL